MITFRADKEKNILFVNMVGIIPKDKMGEGVNEFIQKCSQLKEHFTIINDLTLYQMGTDADFELLCKVTSTMRQKFVIDTIIRIVGTNKKNTAYLLKADEKMGLQNIIYVNTKKDALEAFEKLKS